MRTTFTDAYLRNLEPPAEGRTELSDVACRGLHFRLTINNDRSFSFRYGKVERVPIGKYPDVSLRDARLKADELRRQVAAGKNPAHHRRTASDRTFAALAERYLREYAERHKKTAAADRQALNKHVLPKWKSKDFEQLRRADLIKLIEAIISNGAPTQANRVHSLVSGIFTFAVETDLLPANPFSKLRKRGIERVSTRVASDDELRLFWEHSVLPPVSKATGIALRLALAIGCRAGEAAGMRRSELAFDRQGRPTSWMIPGTRSKNGRANYLPLSPLAVELISEALTMSGDADYVFPSRTAEGAIKGHALTVAMRRIATALPKGTPGADTWRGNPLGVHDLRRTCATRMAALGIPLEDRAAVLGHAPVGVTKRHYDQHERADEKRRALTRWAQALSAILTPPEPNVVALDRRR
jgi:integrase